VRPLKADFVRPARWPIASAWGLAALLLAAGIWHGWIAANAWHRLDVQTSRTADMAAQVTHARAESVARAASASASASFAADARHWMQMSQFDVAGVLRAVEAVQLSGAKVSGLDIDAQAGRADIELEIGSTDVATAYVRALNDGLDRPAWLLVRVQTQGGLQTALIRNVKAPA
jgi:hypothetical protein